MNIEFKKLSIKDTDFINQVAEQLYRDHWQEEGYTLSQSIGMVISRSEDLENGKQFPFIYIAIDTDTDENKVIGRSGLITNDTMLKQEIFPLVMPIHVEKDYIGMGLGNSLMNLVLEAAQINTNFSKVYVFTTLDKFYERLGFMYIEDCEVSINSVGEKIIKKLYMKNLY